MAILGEEISANLLHDDEVRVAHKVASHMQVGVITRFDQR
jgi:hypothetical protein